MNSHYNVSREELITFTQIIIKERSISGEEGSVAKVIAEEMKKLGFEVTTDALGNVIGELNLGPGPCILIDSHMDTVGVTDSSKWTYNPEGEIVDNRLYGRGTMDMKGPLAASVYGAAALKDKLKGGRILVSASIAEELVEGAATVKIAEAVNPDYAIICEATNLKIARGQRGRGEVKIEIFGVPTHSSRPELGINAAELMADVSTALRAIEPPSHEVLGKGILVLTDVLSTPYPANSVVPDYCISTYDRRTLPGETAESILKPIEQIVAQTLEPYKVEWKVSLAVDEFDSYTGQRVEAENFAAAWYYEQTEPLVQFAQSGLKKINQSSDLSYYAFCTNGSGTAGDLKIPTIGYGPGNEELAHRIDEYIDLDELETGAHGYAAIIESIVTKYI
ncbi:YgeY family selenium metabolism-linked hydrolase [Jeotgalibacillus marinus]|uniref:YgeY family selenium metabolism-linked hydrolase n=1 Tax=Jeotgalibacillus marinus TaxID=86667 RepID=A0ABV3Q2Z2_9BACL